MNIYTGDKLATSIDVSYSERMMIPENLVSSIKGIDGLDSMLRFNVYHNQMLAVARMHAFRDAIAVNFGLKMIQLMVLTPVDLAVSKLGRLSETDLEDGCSLARAGLVTAVQVLARGEEAFSDYVCDTKDLQANLKRLADAIRNS